MRGILTDYRCRYQVISKWRDTFGIGKQYKGDDIVATSVERIENRKYRKCDKMLEYEYKQKNGNVMEESYTSKASFFDKDKIPVYNNDNPKEYSFSGKRISRGMYQCKDGMLLNTDVNGALNILRKSKVVSLDAIYDRGVVNTPIRKRLA